MVKLLAPAPEVVEDNSERKKVHREDLKCPARTVAEQKLQLRMWEAFGVDLTAIPGVGVQTALTLLSEVGAEFSAFPSSA